MDYAKLTKDLATAKRTVIIETVTDTNDGGTCNFDTPCIFVKNARLDKLEAAALNAGVRISKWGTGYYHIYGDFLKGQGNLRTRCAEIFTKVLKENGWNAYTYYAID